jgi:hypothetical protein
MFTLIYCLLFSLGAFVLVATTLLTAILVGAIFRAALCLLPYVAAVGISFLLWGCGEPPDTAPLEVYSDVPGYDLAWTQQVIADVEALSGADIDTSGMVVYYAAERNPESCVRASPIALGCTTAEDGTIHVGAVDGQAFSAFILAHELGHNWYYQSEGYSDTHHEHLEWFNDSDQASVVYQIFRLYQ